MTWGMIWLALAAIALPAADKPSYEQITVTHVSQIPADSGLEATYIVLAGDGRKALHFQFFIPHFKAYEHLPRVGDKCRVKFHYGIVDGITGDGPVNLSHERIVEELRCHNTSG